MFCPYTPNSELAKRWREVEARGEASRGWRFRVVELGGRPVKSILCRNPWAGPCSSDRCFICTTGGRGNCGRPAATTGSSAWPAETLGMPQYQRRRRRGRADLARDR